MLVVVSHAGGVHDARVQSDVQTHVPASLAHNIDKQIDEQTTE